MEDLELYGSFLFSTWTMSYDIIFSAHRCIFGERYWLVKSHVSAAQSVTSR